MIHTIISLEDIFYQEPTLEMKKSMPEVKNIQTFSTDPYYYLNKDEYYKKYVQKRN